MKQDMNKIRISFLLAFITGFSYFCFNFIRSYNSPDNIQKRCLSKFQKDFKKNSLTSNKDWGLTLDLADNKYLKCMGIQQY